MEPDSPLGVAERAVATAAGPASGWNELDDFDDFGKVVIATAAGPGSGWNTIWHKINPLRESYCNGCGTGQRVERHGIFPGKSPASHSNAAGPGSG